MTGEHTSIMIKPLETSNAFRPNTEAIVDEDTSKEMKEKLLILFFY